MSFRTKFHPSMRRIRSNFHRLHALKDARPKLRRAIIANSDKELLHSISECALNVLKGTVELSDCKKRKLRKFKRQLRAIVHKRVPLARKKKLIIQRGGIIVLLTAVHSTLAKSFTISLRVHNMLRKMYLVSPEYVSHRSPPVPPTPAPQQQPKVAKPKSKQRRRRETKRSNIHMISELS